MADSKDMKLSREQYSVVVEIDAPIEKCFAAGSAEAAMMQWVPGIKSVVYDQSGASEPYGAGSERKVTMNSGMTLVEKIHASKKPTFIAYHIPSMGFVGDLLILNYQGHMKFESLGPNRTRLAWIGHFDCPGLRKITEPLMRKAMKGVITTMANKLKQYVEGK